MWVGKLCVRVSGCDGERGKGGERREEEKKVKFVPVENGADRGRNLLLPMIQLDPDDKRRHLLLEANHHER